MAARPTVSVVYRDGPWAHQSVSANGNRFHVVSAGTGPLVLLLPGYPEFWWSWRHQLGQLAAAGYRAVAVDLRGTGGSDKPPRGYDLQTLAADTTQLIRALGEPDAAIVGHDVGGAIGWTAATMRPAVVRGLVLVGAAHPLSLRRAMFREWDQFIASRHMFGAQLPRYEHLVTARDGAYAGALLRRWAGDRWRATDDFAAYEAACREAIRIPQASFCALEHFRWSLRSLVRREGWTFAAELAAGADVPVTQLHGELDRCVLPATARDGRRYAARSYEWRSLPGVGHFPQAEAPAETTTAILAALADLDDPTPDRV